MRIRELIVAISQSERDREAITIADPLQALDEIEDGDAVVDEDAIVPSSPLAKRPADRYQTKIKKRSRYQNGNDSRWQAPQGHSKPNSPQQ